MQVNILEAKNQLSKLVKAAQAGEEVIIANHGVPAVRLLPVTDSAPARSLADELADLRDLLGKADTELPTPSRTNRTSPFAPSPQDDDLAD